MGRVLMKCFKGFTVSSFHDSEHCDRCLRLCSFYNKKKKKDPPWDMAVARKTANSDTVSKYKFFGVISYLTSYIRIENISFEEYKKNREIYPPIMNINLVNGKEIRYFRELNVEERKDLINHPDDRTVTYTMSDRIKTYIKRLRLEDSTTKRTCSRRKVKRKTVKRRSVTDHTQKTNTDRTLKDRNKYCKNTKKAQKVSKDVENPSSKDFEDKKEPGKGTLKHKRWFINKLKSKEDYEDDLFHDRLCFGLDNVPPVSNDALESDSNEVENMATPTWGFSLSPRQESESPTYEDCYSPSELSASRKEAEEYQYRRCKRRKTMLLNDKSESSVDSSQMIKTESPDPLITFENACKILMQQTKAEKDSSAESDYYFSDSSEDQSSV